MKEMLSLLLQREDEFKVFHSTEHLDSLGFYHNSFFFLKALSLSFERILIELYKTLLREELMHLPRLVKDCDLRQKVRVSHSTVSGDLSPDWRLRNST